MSAQAETGGARRLLGRLAPDAAAVGLLWLLILAFLWPLVTPDAAARQYFGRGDLSDQFYAFRHFSAAGLWAGDLPLWNPDIYAGHPATADIQSAVFYPLSLLATLLADPAGPSLYQLQLEVLANIWLGALFMYLFARRAAGRRGPAALAALVFALGGYLTSYPPEQLPVLQGAIWLPLALFFADRAIGSVGKALVVNGAWCGLALGVSVLAGHPQVAMLCFYTTLLYLAYGLLRGGRWREALAAPALAGVVGLGAGAVQWAPTLELMAVSTRAVMPFDDAQAGFPLGDVLSPLFPGFVGRGAPLYVGLLPLLLAAAAVWTMLDARRCSEPEQANERLGNAPFWFAMAVASFVLGFGGGTFLYSLPYLAAPGFGIFRGQERLALVYTVAVALLAALGARWLMGEGRGTPTFSLRDWRKPVLWGFAVCAGLVLAFGEAMRRADAAGALVLSFLIERSVHAGLALAGALVVIVFRLRGRLMPAALLGAALVVTAADLTGVNWPAGIGAQDPTAAYSQYPAIVRYLQEQPRPFRVQNDKVLPENAGAVLGISMVQGNSPLRISALQDLEAGVDAWRFWQLTNVRYVISRGDPGPGATLVMREGDAALYRLDGPRAAWVVGTARLTGAAEAVALLASPNFEPYVSAIVGDAALAALDGKPGQVAVTVYRPQYMALDARSEGRGLLVVSEVYYPGWRARVDGKEAPVYRVDHALRGVVLPPGEHRVELYYQPLSLFLGAIVTALTVVTVALCMLWWRR